MPFPFFRPVVLAWMLCLSIVATGQNFVGPRQIAISTAGNLFPSTITVGDVNGDGRPDILWGESLVAQGSGLVHVLLAQPSGDYVEVASKVSTSSSQVCRIADVNGDHKADLVCGGPNGLEVHLGAGDGTFPVALPATGYSFAANQISEPVDLNQDGILDFLVADTVNTYVLLGDGNGSFSISYTFSYSTFTPSQVSDVNGDGIPDLLVYGPAVSLGLGGGRFGPFTSYGSNDSCTFGDVDHDGHLDAICAKQKVVDNVDATGIETLTVQHGRSDGSFNTTPLLTQTYGDPSNVYDGTPTVSGLFQAADLNGDGLIDVLEVNSDGLGVLLGETGPSFSDPIHFGAEYIRSNYVQPVVLTDMDGDGNADLISAGLYSILISYGKGDGSFAAVPAQEVAKYVQGGTVADFNGDGIPDVATVGDQSVEVSLGRGDGTFLPYAPQPRGDASFIDRNNYGVAFSGDFNGDGKRDLIAYGGTDQYDFSPYMLLGNGDGSLREPIRLAAGNNFSTNQVQVVDLNGDGKDDILYTNNDSAAYSGPDSTAIVASLSNGDGSFRTVSSPVAAEPYGPYFYGISPPRVRDLDGDGKADAAFASKNFLYVVRGHGDGTFDGTGTKLAVPAQLGYLVVAVTSIAIADLDGDGLPDIALSADLALKTATYISPTSSEVVVYYGSGGLAFSPGQIGQFLPIFGLTLQAQDLRGEGRPELIAFPASFYSVAETMLLHVTPARVFDPPQLVPAGIPVSGVSIADLNQDGKFDLLVVGSGSNVVYPILNLGTTATVSGTLQANPEPSGYGQTFTLTATLRPPDAATALKGEVSFSVDGLSLGTQTLSGNAATITVPGNLTVGPHAAIATWAGDATYPALTLRAPHVVAGLVSTIALNSSLNPAQVGQTVSYTARVSGASGLPTGSVTFSDGQSLLGTSRLSNATGENIATITTIASLVGVHTITATYGGYSVFSASSTTITETVTSLSDSASLTASPQTASVYQPVTLSFRLSGVVAGAIPSGTVTFTDAGRAIGTASVDANGQANLSYVFPLAGTHTLTASFADDPAYASASATATETVTTLATKLALTSSLNPSARLQPVTFHIALTSAETAPLAGPVTLFDGSTQLSSLALDKNGSANYTTSVLAAGDHSISAVFGGVADVLQPSTSASLTQIISKIASTTTLTVTPSPGIQGGGSVTLTTSVNDAANLTATGTIALMDGATLLATVPLTNGVAIWSTTEFTSGAHMLTSMYTGDGNLLSSQSDVVPEQVVLSDFQLATTPPSITIRTGHNLTFSVAGISIGAFTDSVQLAFTDIPNHVTIRPNSKALQLKSGDTSSMTVYLDTDDVIGYLSAASVQAPGTAIGIVWAGLLPSLFFGLMGRRWRRKVSLGRLLLFACALSLLAGASGCSGKYPASAAPGTYTIKMTGTGLQTSISHTINLELIVTE